MAGPHDGHRDRMRERIARDGINSLQDHELLEYMLFAFVPRKDTNEMGHALLDLCGSLKAVFDASPETLLKVRGMTKNAALFLTSMPDISRRYLGGEQKRAIRLSDRSMVRNYLAPNFKGLTVETVYGLALDSHSQVISCELLKKGKTGDNVDISVREIIDFAIKTKASEIVLAHNHPSGKVKPSQKDVEFTSSLYMTLSGLRFKLDDHIIFGLGQDYYSFAESGQLKLIKEIKSMVEESLDVYQ